MSAAYEGYSPDELDEMEAGCWIDPISGEECSIVTVLSDHEGAVRLSVRLTGGDREVVIPVPALHSLHGCPWLYEEVAS